MKHQSVIAKLIGKVNSSEFQRINSLPVHKGFIHFKIFSINSNPIFFFVCCQISKMRFSQNYYLAIDY
jgi:hypothetical protein